MFVKFFISVILVNFKMIIIRICYAIVTDLNLLVKIQLQKC